MMMKLRPSLILFLVFFIGAADAQKQTAPVPTEDRDPSGLLRELIATRGVNRWTTNDVLMGSTWPPMQPVKTVPEWDKARAVMFAVDPDMIKSFSLNRRIRTTNTAIEVYQKKTAVAEVLNEVICQPDETDDQDTDVSDSKNASARAEAGCEEGELDPVSLDRYFDELAIAHDFVATVGQLSRFVDVVLLVNSSISGDLAIRRLIENLKTFDAARDLLASPHVFFVQSTFDTKWIRDYGPLFIRDSEGAITFVDTRYDPQSTTGSEEVKQLAALVQELRQRSSNEPEVARLERTAQTEGARSSRLKDDQFPTVMAPRFRQRDGTLLRRNPVSVVRPPISLSGGDFLTDGAGTGFTSLRTLRDNGGNIEVMDLNFKKYMGIESVVYLHPLPGETVKHIDMFLQTAGPNVLLLGKFSKPSGDSGEARLQSAAFSAMEDNLAIIRDHYRRMGKSVKVIDDDTFTLDPHAINIVRVPMPQVARPFADAYESLVREVESAVTDYDEHSTLLRLISRFQSRLDDLELENRALVKTVKEATEQHVAADHDLELVDALDSTNTDLSKIIIRYARLTNQHARESDKATGAAERLKSVLQQLRTSAKDNIEHKQPLNHNNLQAAIAAAAEVGQVSHEFLDQVQEDKEKEASLVQASVRRAIRAAFQAKKMQNEYEYGTDLYRTYLNLLPVRTRQSFVLVIPSYRDQTLRGEGESATVRILGAYRQLYGSVEVVSAPSDAFIKELGSIHCLTKILPEEVEFLSSERNRATGEQQ